MFFTRSRLYQSEMVSPSTTLNYSDWWGHYNLASYYERLREEGRI